MDDLQNQYDKAKAEQHLKARQAFRKFWIAGTAGAFFAGLARTLPLDITTASWHPDGPYTLALFVRYGYVFWLLGYFFTSTFLTDQEKPESSGPTDVVYDILQSTAGLAAVFYLGFVNRAVENNAIVGFRAANSAIVAVTLLAWILFPSRNPLGSRIAALRTAGLLLGAAGLATALFADRFAPPSVTVGVILALVQLVLWLVLAWYWGMRWHEPMLPQAKDREPFDEEPFAREDWNRFRGWLGFAPKPAAATTKVPEGNAAPTGSVEASPSAAVPAPEQHKP